MKRLLLSIFVVVSLLCLPIVATANDAFTGVVIDEGEKVESVEIAEPAGIIMGPTPDGRDPMGGQKIELEPETKVVKKESTYTVVPGDNLSKIAARLLGDANRWPEIVEWNKDQYPQLESNPNLIYSGWTFKIIQEETVTVEPEKPAEPEKPEEPKVEENEGIATDTLTRDIEWTATEKLAAMQSAVDKANQVLQQQRKRLVALDENTIRWMIQQGFLSEEDWMAMNPPEGYTYLLSNDGKTVTFVNKDGEPITAEELEKIDKEVEKRNDERDAEDKPEKKSWFKDLVEKIKDKIGEFKDKVDEKREERKREQKKQEEERKKAEEERKQQETKVLSDVNEQFKSDVASMGMKDLRRMNIFAMDKGYSIMRSITHPNIFRKNDLNKLGISVPDFGKAPYGLINPADLHREYYHALKSYRAAVEARRADPTLWDRIWGKGSIDETEKRLNAMKTNMNNLSNAIKQRQSYAQKTAAELASRETRMNKRMSSLESRIRAKEAKYENASAEIRELRQLQDEIGLVKKYRESFTKQSDDLKALYLQ
ncbi:MAG: LysM peptidoglycan-binding domain-containing protein [Candidatus Riflebacteria bacterium]|nr:LysM peptidoglycan-binding domain-containing protein [Candidatus Riflebacteria bacterium]